MSFVSEIGRSLVHAVVFATGVMATTAAVAAERVFMDVRMERSDLATYTIVDSGQGVSVRGRPRIFGYPGTVDHNGVRYDVQAAYTFASNNAAVLAFEAYLGQDIVGTQPNREAYVFVGTAAANGRLEASLKQFGSSGTEYILRGNVAAASFSIRLSKLGFNWYQVRGEGLNLNVRLDDRDDRVYITINGTTPSRGGIVHDQLALVGASLGFLWMQAPI